MGLKEKLLVLLALWAHAATAWWCDGHMAVAQIARNSGLISASSLQKVDALIAVLAPTYGTMSDSMVTAACWADDLKSQGAAEEAAFHFVDLPVLAPGYTGAIPTLQNGNVVNAINNSHATTYSKKSMDLDKARQLRFIIHFVGDIHQPLHAASYYSDQFPGGDAGGNLWPIAGPTWVPDLHGYWDGGAGQWTDDLVRPLNSTGTDVLDTLTTAIMNKFPVSSLQPEIENFNVSSWAVESNTIASSFVYTAPQAPTPIPDAYQTQAEEIALKQVAIAGYRLGSLLEYIFHLGAWR